MSAWLWAGVLVAAVWAAHWGAERMAKPLQMLRRQWGISAAAGGALIGIASASPEIGINVASAVRGVSDIGLGASLGSNVIAIPLVVAIAYWASRTERLGNDRGAQRRGRRSGGGGGDNEDRSNEDRSSDNQSVDRTERGAAHARHLKSGILRTE